MTVVPPAERAVAPVRNRAIGRLKLAMVVLVCAAPVIASYLAYYVFPPASRTNFGTLIEPQRPVRDFPAMDLLAGGPYRISALRGQWVLVQVDTGACAKACTDKLYALRQQRTMTGKERDRVERLWLVTDATRPEPATLRDYDGTLVVAAARPELEALLPVEPGRRMEDYLFLIDPMGNLMMRFPADGDPARIRKDIGRLLKASRVG